MLTITEITDGAVWDAALLALPNPHILQSWAWGETKAQTGWSAKRLLWRDDNRPLAAAALLTRRLHPRLPLTVAYVPKGPLLDWSDAEQVAAVLDHLEKAARRAHSIFIKLDPDVQANTSLGAAVVATLTRRGWRFSAEQIQYRNTVISDLTADEAKLLAGMKSKWRYNIRLAERRGVVVRDGITTDLPIFYAMYAETGRRDGFLVRPYSYYELIWKRFLAGGLAHLLLAEVAGQAVAGLMLFRFGTTAWYFYGASTVRARNLMPNHALQWAAIRWAKAVGCTRYDWWGAPDELDGQDPMWGVYRFKMGFGGEFVPHIGAWDYPVSQPLYRLYRGAMPRLLDLARRRHRATGD